MTSNARNPAGLLIRRISANQSARATPRENTLLLFKIFRVSFDSLCSICFSHLSPCRRGQDSGEGLYCPNVNGPRSTLPLSLTKGEATHTRQKYFDLPCRFRRLSRLL